MDIVLSGLTYVICLCYLDDVIVFGRNIDEHCEHLDTVYTFSVIGCERSVNYCINLIYERFRQIAFHGSANIRVRHEEHDFQTTHRKFRVEQPGKGTFEAPRQHRRTWYAFLRE